MIATTHLITAEELWLMPHADRLELVRGEIRRMAPTGFDHGAIVVTVAAMLSAYVKKHSLGVVVGGEAGFTLARNPDIVRAADVGFVSASRIPASGRTVKYWEGAPDLAVDVTSPSDTLQEVEDKVADYLDAGTRLVWVINPRRRTATLYQPGTNPVILRQTDRLEGFDVLPGFYCAVSELFV